MSASRRWALALLVAPGFLLASWVARTPAAGLAQPKVLMLRSLPADSGRVDVAADVLPVPEGALIAGWSTMGEAPADAFLLRVDRGGELLWRRSMGGDGADLLFSVQPDGQGGHACAGFTAGRGAGGTDGWVVGVDTAGVAVWERTYGGVGDERLVSLRSTSEGWIAAGQTDRGGNVDAWVLRLDRTGKELGSWTWGGSGVERAFGVEPTADGGCVIVGSIGQGEKADGFVTRLGADGRQVWTQRIEGPGRQIAYHLRPCRDASYLVTGYGFASRERDDDADLMRIGADGKILWRSRLGGPLTDRGVQSVVLDDGLSIVVGYSKSRDSADADPVWRTILYGVDPRGRPLWALKLGGAGRESGRWIAGTAEDLWVVAQTTSEGRSRVLVARLDASALVQRRGGGR